jgi:hypothetical protein
MAFLPQNAPYRANRRQDATNGDGQRHGETVRDEKRQAASPDDCFIAAAMKRFVSARCEELSRLEQLFGGQNR